MKSTSVHRFRSRLQANEPVYGVRVTLEAGAVSDIAAGLGFDWIVIDAAHGHLDWAEVLEHIRATARCETLALVRLAGASPEDIQHALDLGADGVLMSGVETTDQLRSIVKQFSANVPQDSEASALIVPVINMEWDQAKLRDMISVDDVELFFFELQSLESTSIKAAQDQLLADLRSQGKHAGIVAESDEALSEYYERKFRMLGVGSDLEIIRRGVQSTLKAVAATTKL